MNKTMKKTIESKITELVKTKYWKDARYYKENFQEIENDVKAYLSQMTGNGDYKLQMTTDNIDYIQNKVEENYPDNYIDFNIDFNNLKSWELDDLFVLAEKELPFLYLDSDEDSAEMEFIKDLTYYDTIYSAEYCHIDNVNCKEADLGIFKIEGKFNKMDFNRITNVFITDETI